jgi:cytochrome c biogenesis protein CcmG/thiol:disulfide interchange protein DsbE
MKKLSVLIILGLLACLVLGSTSFAGNAPSFSLKDIKGNWVDSSDLFGNYLIFIMFWSTDCQACKDSMPYLQDLYDKYYENGLKMICIATDSERTSDRVRPYIDGQGYTFAVLLDTDQYVRDSFNVNQEPYYFLIDLDGNIVFSYSGFTPGTESVFDEAIGNTVSVSGGGGFFKK